MIIDPALEVVGRDALAEQLTATTKVAYVVLVAAADDAAEAVTQAAKTTGAEGDWPLLLAGHEVPTAPDKALCMPIAAGPISRLIVVVGAPGGPARRAAAAAIRAAGRSQVVALDVRGPEAVSEAIEGALLAMPGTHLGPQPATAPARPRLLLVGEPDPDAVTLGRVGARATLLARSLASTPSNIKNPPWLAALAADLAREAGLGCRVWDEGDLAAEGFGGIIAVGSGAATPPRLVEIDYAPGDPDEAPIVLVGKGITFDTGGLNVKPAAGMLLMKTDMSGAAIVLSVITALRDLAVRRRVVALLPLAENAMGGNSYRPSDVVTHYGGTTVEIGNTDAEGRIVLADALAYAVARLNPAALVDIATLTGAATIALGRGMAPSYASDEALRERVHAGFASAGEPLWAMPLVEDYRPLLDSGVADLCHIGPIGGSGAGSILAALFLREFTGGLPWVHLDIAGPGRSESETGILPKGPTGYGARGLLHWLTKE